ncbi:MAG: cysteine--tRNA ligase [Kiritimatiellae bacterium]|nr:cysteine--tRNA ligase [Kiritimatiellia bacterium]
MTLHFHNTLTRQIEEFAPIERGHVRLYTCGPTVYSFAHIGNFRAYVFEDLLRRSLRYVGYRVTQVMNLTDVDDKTIRGAQAAGVPLRDFTRPFTEAFFEDLRKLNIEAAERYPAATDHVPEMIALIERLFARGLAYRSEDGSVYFNVAKFPGYGRPAHIDLSGMRGGARVAQDEYEKESVGDFALWKAWDSADGEVAWDSPWGRGRPGWHIECSAMSMKYLGETFDLHTGGIDNLFPHHANETAQSEGATGKPFVKTWLHCAHLRVNGEKMSKSLGNFHTLRDLTAKGWSGREVRYVLVNGHYRQTLNFTFEALAGARAALARLDEFVDRLRSVAAGAVAGALPEWADAAAKAFEQAIADDLNLPEALAALFGAVREGNAALDANRLTAAQAAALDAMLTRCDGVLGLLNFGRAAPADDAPLPDDVRQLLDARAAARKARDWTQSDLLRDRLAAAGWEVRDTAGGQQVKRR